MAGTIHATLGSSIIVMMRQIDNPLYKWFVWQWLAQWLRCWWRHPYPTPSPNFILFFYMDPGKQQGWLTLVALYAPGSDLALPWLLWTWNQYMVPTQTSSFHCSNKKKNRKNLHVLPGLDHTAMVWQRCTGSLQNPSPAPKYLQAATWKRNTVAGYAPFLRCLQWIQVQASNRLSMDTRTHTYTPLRHRQILVMNQYTSVEGPKRKQF